MKRALVIIIVSLLGGALAVEALAQSAATAPTIGLQRILVTMPAGQRFGTLQYGVGQACLPEKSVGWTGERDLDNDEFQEPFMKAVRSAGMAPPAAATNLFADSSTSQSDYAVGAVISQMNFTACRFAYNPAMRYSGTGKIDVEWQIYSQVERKVVATIKTSGLHQQNGLTADATPSLVFGAFGDSAAKMFASPEFKAAIARPAPSAAPASSAALEPLTLTAGPATPMPISDATGSVVAVLAGGGHGSGFLVSNDGHFLTNQHVVGDLKQVRIRWSDGLESVAQVLRSDRRRDVALLKVENSRGRTPLKVRASNVQPGDAVIAVGTPIDPQYQNTVTRGVASGNRILDGFSFLQSDVAISPGNSGGPLLDDQGAVVAITVLKDGRGENLNFFIPIRDALDFLSLTVR